MKCVRAVFMQGVRIGVCCLPYRQKVPILQKSLQPQTSTTIIYEIHWQSFVTEGGHEHVFRGDQLIVAGTWCLEILQRLLHEVEKETS